VPNGHPVAVTQDFATSGSGVIQLTSTADSLGVGGNVSFGGGSTAGLLTAGIITLKGNFTQAGDPSSYAPTLGGTHRLSLRGTATQNISMANPSAATSHFDVLEIQDASRNVVLQTSAFVNDSLWMQAGAAAYTMNGAGTSQRLTIAGQLRMDQSTGSPKLSPPVVELSVPPLVYPGIPGTFSPDTVVFLGTLTSIPTGAGMTYNSIRINTASAMSFFGGMTIAKDMVISAGSFSVPANSTFVALGKLRTTGTGVLTMTGPYGTMSVGDSAIFGGGSESGQLTAGTLQVGGNFVEQAGTPFPATGSHRTVFNRGTSGVQTIQFADPVNSYFHDLALNRPIVDTVRMLSDVQVQDSAIVAGKSVLASTNLEALKTPATGAVRVHSGGVLKPSRVEIGLWGSLSADSAFNGGARIMPDTTVFLGVKDTITSNGPAYAWKNVRVGGDTLMTQGTVYNGNLIASGGLYTFPSCCNGTDSVKGFLRTEGSGTIQLNSGDGTYYEVVRDSAVFAGGDETGLLVNSYLVVGGDFVQRGGANSFVATNYHQTLFNGAGPHTVTFASPGSSQFAYLLIENSSGGAGVADGITLGSDIYVSGYVQDSSFSVTDSIAGNGHTVYAGGISLGSQFVMNNARLVTNSTSLYESGLTFRNMDPTVTQWTIQVPSIAALSLSNVNFLTAPTSGLYFAAQADTVGVSLSFSGTLTPSYAALNGSTLYTTINGAFTANVVWGGLSLPNR